MHGHADLSDGRRQQNRPHPLGNPSLDHADEYKLREKLVLKALRALTTEVEDQTIFDD